MFVVNDDMSIYLTRGDVAFFTVTADNNGKNYVFQPGDVVRMKVTEKKACENVMFQKDFPVTEEAEKVDILLTEEETKIGEVISKPTDYWYEIELNPFTNPQTIVGYDEDGAKILRLFPEGIDLEPTPIEPTDIPVVDNELSLTSDRPVQNQAIARAITGLGADIKYVRDSGSERMATIEGKLTAEASRRSEEVARLENDIAVERARISTLVANAGNTDGNAELLDIRVGADGTTYATAGDAVRGQIGELEGRLTGFIGGVMTNKTDDLTVNGEYIESNGVITSASSWSRSEAFSVPETLKRITIVKASRYASVAFFYSDEIGPETFISRLYAADAITENNPISMDVPKEAKCYVISNNNNNSEFECVLDYADVWDAVEYSKDTRFMIIGDSPSDIKEKDLDIKGKYIKTDGTLDTASSFSASSMIEISELVESVTINSSGKNSGLVVAFYKTNEFLASSFISGESSPNNAVTSSPVTVAKPKGAKYIAVCNRVSGETYPLDITVNYKTVSEALSENEKDAFQRVYDVTIPILFDNTKKVKIIGDSITAGVGGTGYETNGEVIYGEKRVNENGHCWANSLKDYLYKKFGVVAKNYGVSGINSRQMFNNISSLVSSDDDLVVCMIGTNDRHDTYNGVDSTVQSYMENLLKIKRYCDGIGVPVVFMASIPASVENETDGTRHFHMEDVDMACCKFASENQMEYVSVYKKFIEYCKYTNTTIDSYLSDGLHPNDNGYDVMFYIIANALGFSTERPDATW